MASKSAGTWPGATVIRTVAAFGLFSKCILTLAIEISVPWVVRLIGDLLCAIGQFQASFNLPLTRGTGHGWEASKRSASF